MKLFIDSADIKEIEKAVHTGLVDGVTTNPSLLAKANAAVLDKSQLYDYYERIAKIVRGDVSVEVISTDYEGMVEEGLAMASINPHIIVKIPLTVAGLRAIKELKERRNIRTNCTLVFSAAQALLAAKARAFYISAFIGRLDDAGKVGDGMRVLEQICDLKEYYGFEAHILAASIRSPQQVEQCIDIGVDALTCPYAVFKALFEHPLTDIGLKKFLSDYKEAKAKGP